MDTQPQEMAFLDKSLKAHYAEVIYELKRIELPATLCDVSRKEKSKIWGSLYLPKTDNVSSRTNTIIQAS